ncbi:GntR family transcriptional regulator [Eubacterium maltosivorans]|uniref:GntR family transcriptional regulator n=1 Tax=Eubacterium maltosivorans TaxID=2041044 RepID=UPI00189F101D|nr:GntR family transcriptional regulator [Eubacterium maltosivorans]
MDIIISNSSGKPIYEQITTQIKNKIITGELRPGDALPSMRVLAKELRISVITTKRAYADLEQDGFIETAPGKGSFVAQKNTEFIREENYRQIQELLEQAVELSQGCGLTLSEFTELITLLYKGDS